MGQKYIIDEDTLVSIADAIRDRTGYGGELVPEDFSTYINYIPGMNTTTTYIEGGSSTIIELPECFMFILQLRSDGNMVSEYNITINGGSDTYYIDGNTNMLNSEGGLHIAYANAFVRALNPTSSFEESSTYYIGDGQITIEIDAPDAGSSTNLFAYIYYIS